MTDSTPATTTGLDVAVYGIINAGKSSLINALAGRDARPASPIGGTTVDVAAVAWTVISSDAESENPTDSRSLFEIRLIDTPGLEEVAGEDRGKLATAAATRADLILFVLAEDLTATAKQALVSLRAVGKPMVVVVNKVDLLDDEARVEVIGSIRESLAGIVPAEDVVEASAAPIVRRRVEQPQGGWRTETVRGEPEVGALASRLRVALAESAADLKALAAASAVVEDHLIDRDRDRNHLRARAVRVADETSAALAVALAVNPIPLLDFLAGPGGLAVLVRRVSEVYGEPLSAETARGLALDLIRGGRAVMWGSLAATVAGGAMKILPGLGHLAGALTQGAAAGYFGHVVGRALVDYLENGRDWGDGGLVAALDRVAASTDRRALTRGLVDRIKARLKKGTP